MRRMSWVLGIGMLAVLAGLPQSKVCAGTDTTPPTGTIVINNNRSATNSTSVTLSLTWDDGVGGSGVSRMRFSDDGSHWTAWEALTATRAYTLPAGADGHRTVRVQYLDRANNRSAAASDYILLDTTRPTGTIIINGGAATTNSQTVSLGLTWSDGSGAGVTRMRFSDNGSTWTAWETPVAKRTHKLPPEPGYHTVRVQYLDGANNYSVVFTDYIKLVEPVPGTEETVMLPGNVPLVMVWVPSGTFVMGRYAGEQDSTSKEDPQHSVKLWGFWMGKYEVTKQQWQTVMATAPWSGWAHVLEDPNAPAEYLSWNDAKSFVAALNSGSDMTFALPSEAQWEYACRAGESTRFYWGDDLSNTDIGNYAWFTYNAFYYLESYAHMVGKKLPNGFGLYDMSGNVQEYCEDDWHSSYVGAPTGGEAWVDNPRGASRVMRGGSMTADPQWCRSAFRSSCAQGTQGLALGCRIVRIP